MAESKKSTSADTHIPPPPDPFPTYQTPYSRHTHDAENPFISFRRFADEQFNSFFSGLPRVLGVPTSAPHTKSEVRDPEERSLEQAARLQVELDEMVRCRHEEAEGFRKQMEQEREERRMENEKRNDEENTRWTMMQRGIKRCPALKSDADEPATELDMYDRLDDERQYEKSKRREHGWKHEGRKGWLTGLGWDGQGQARNAHNESTTNTKSQQDLKSLNIKPEEHLADLDPFNYDDDLHTYLTESKYSPIRLMLPNCFASWRNPSLQGIKSTPEIPPATDLDQRMADHVQWSEAFNDLLALERTGELPTRNRHSIFDMAPFRASANSPFGDLFTKEMKRLTEKSPRREPEEGDKFRDGDFWDGDIDISPLGTGVMALLMGAALSGIPIHAVRNVPDTPQQESTRYHDAEPEPKTADFGVRGILWPGPEEILSLIDQVKQLEVEAGPHDEPAEDKAEDQPITHDSVTSSSSSSSSSSMFSEFTNTNTNKNNLASIISTMTTTQTRTLPDGTTETRRILKRRFADGREECDESVEVRPGSDFEPLLNQPTILKPDRSLTSNSQISGMIKSNPKGNEQKRSNDKTTDGGGGWFWN